MIAAKIHQQTMDKVQNQALRIITGTMITSSTEKMEQITEILSKRREKCKALAQVSKYKHSPEHLISAKKKTSGRLKRSSFARDTCTAETILDMTAW